MNNLDENLLEDNVFDSNIINISDLPDGSSVYEFGEDDDDEEVPDRNGSFYENLADYLDEDVLTSVASNLLEGIDQDKESRQEWEQHIETGIKYSGSKMEGPKDSGPFISSCRAFDTTLSSAEMRYYATVKTELFPDGGPANTKTAGDSDAYLDDQSERIKLFMNYYLTQVDKEYYPDSERVIRWTSLAGSVFRKVYQDPILNRPIARFINPQDFIVNNNCVSILSSDRLTHVLHLSRKDILLRQMKGLYRDIDLPDYDDDLDDNSVIKETVNNIQGISPQQTEKKSSLLTLYEVHCDIDLEEADSFTKKDDKRVEIPLPYIVTICATTRKIFSIYRNWKENDPSFSRRNYFVQYNYLPGLGLYGYSLTQLLGSNAIALTSILRQLIDRGTLCNFPGGLRVKGMRLENNDKPIGPGEFLEVETGGLPLRDAISPMPYGEPSSVLRELRNDVIQQTASLASIAESAIAESNPNAPVGTTMMNLEVSNKLQSVVLSSFRESLSYELQLLFDLFGEYLPEGPYPFKVPGKEVSVMRQDFNDRVQIIPVSDPVLITGIQRNLQNQAVLQLAQAHPQFFNMKSVIEKTLQGLHVRDIESLMIQQEEAEPLDAGTEDANAILGKPVVAAMWQDDDAHIISHEDTVMRIPETAVILNPHIATHKAQRFLKQLQQSLGYQLPPLEKIKDPEVQNMISFQIAQVALQRQAAEQQAQQEQTINPQQVMLMDIEQRQKAAELKFQEAQLKSETEAFKAQLNFETEKNKQQTERDLMEEKLDAEFEIQQLKMQEKDSNYV